MACMIRVVGPVQKSHAIDDEPSSQDSDGVSAPPVELSMEQAVQQILDEEGIVTDTWSTTRDGSLFKVDFSVVSEDKLENVLDRLAFFNVGKTAGSSIMVIEPTAFICKRERTPKSGTVPQAAFQDFIRTLKSRLCVAQVYNEIKQRGTFDMNYLCFLICAGLIADIALVTNSAGVVFASMLLSPLMDPILCILFGLTLREKHMLRKGVRNTAISLLLCVCMGLTFGYVAHSVSNFEQVTPYPTSEMKQRGQSKSLLASMLVAGFSGISVAFATLSKRLAALIGNAISLSLLPPAVNSMSSLLIDYSLQLNSSVRLFQGQLLLLSILAYSQKTIIHNVLHTNQTNLTVQPRCPYPWIRNYQFIYVEDECDAAVEFALLSAFSFLLVSMNILLILITGYSVNKIIDIPLSVYLQLVLLRMYDGPFEHVIRVTLEHNAGIIFLISVKWHLFRASELFDYHVRFNIRANLLTYWIKHNLKDMAPRSFTNETVRRFYQKDLAEVRGTYDCLHKLDAGELASYAYKEYLRLNQINPEAADALDAEESQRIASDYCAVLQGVGKDPHIMTVSAKAGQDNSQFLQSFLARSKMLAKQSTGQLHSNVTVHDRARVNGYGLENGIPIPGAHSLYHTMPAPASLRQFGTLCNRRTTLYRLHQLERLGELDYESTEGIPLAKTLSSKPSSTSFNDQAQPQNVGKFHVTPTQLALNQMDSVQTDENLDRV
ncbi:uncharacterized protein DEA37_0007225 [Paragonimus westermani]|uniref:DUF389 domain-containing protein n=1 Tax=Paragonimus westermani TaxID=34504 RepID=A0A5J4P3E5_9TREM|nr:uncharacterized protein DEA37_0007225 [Paragonimus westermani]